VKADEFSPSRDDLARWRKGERRRLIDERLAVPASERQRSASAVLERLVRLLSGIDNAVVSLYWPFRGELNLRPLMPILHKSGVRVSLPLVEAADRPLIFREWTPLGRMETGIWKIPVPVDGEVLPPSIIVAPLVGYDGCCYRLGYGGAFFDRTLEHLRADGGSPQVIGVGHSGARIPTIYPQPHDGPMDVIITEAEQIERPGSGETA